MQHAILTLIRHAETTGNLNRLLQGVTDSPVTVFGQAQIEALASTWATTLSPASNHVQGDDKAKMTISKLDLPPPTLIVCSSTGRARKTAEAIHCACTNDQGGSAGIIEDLFQPGSSARSDVAAVRSSENNIALLVDSGLVEKDFGWKESTRGGVHVAGYPKGHGSGESHKDFVHRVHRVGAEWLAAAATLASAGSQGIIPHVVLVTHGMWISTFLSTHPPTTMTQASAQPGFLPFAANTGMFSLKVQVQSLNNVDTNEATDRPIRPITELFRVNDTRHLAHVKRQKGGFGRSAFDRKQTKLSSFFSRSVNDSKDDSVETQEPPMKKLKK